MSDFYIRHNVGSDAADGSKATPWATITAGATAARIAPGDNIYLGKSPDPVRVSGPTGTDLNATWTKNSNTVTLSGTGWKEIQACNATTGFVASANITVATSTNRREGTNSISITPAGAFTTGLAAYVPVSALDLTGYTGISFWAINNSGTTAANVWRIDLCSDAVGAVPVYSFTIDRALLSGNGLSRFYYDTGGSMTTAINSVAITALSDPGTQALIIDNIVACTSECNLYSLFGKDSTAAIGTGIDDGWYAIESFAADGVTAKTIGLYSTTTPTSITAFAGTSETVALYSRQLTVFGSSTQEVIQDSGTSGSPITFQGGYDFVGDAVNGETILYFPFALGLSIPTNWIVMNNISVVGVASPNRTFVCAGSGNVLTIPIAGSSSDAAILTTSGNRNSIHIYHAWGCTNITTISSNNGSIICDNASGVTTSCYTITGGVGWKCHVKNASPGTGSVVFALGAAPGIQNRLSFENTQNYGSFVTASSNVDGAGVDIYQIEGGVNEAPGSSFISSGNYTSLVLRNVDAPPSGTIVSSTNYPKVVFERYDQTADNHRIYGHSGTLEWETSTAQTHGTSGISWKGTPLSSRDINTPAIFDLAGEHLIGGEAVVFSVWVYLTNASSIVTLKIYGGQIEGIDNDVTVQANTGTLNSWQQLTLASVTPTVTGSLKLTLEAYGSASAFYFGDLDVA